MRFDPGEIAYEDLLEIFWASHDPTRPKGSTQYRAALFCADERDQARAEASKDALEEKLGDRVETEIIVGATFYPAEAYHQKWRLRRQGALFEDLQRRFPSEAALLVSAAATKVNGFVSGRIEPHVLERYMERLGLSERSQRELKQLTER